MNQEISIQQIYIDVKLISSHNQYLEFRFKNMMHILM